MTTFRNWGIGTGFIEPVSCCSTRVPSLARLEIGLRARRDPRDRSQIICF